MGDADERLSVSASCSTERPDLTSCGIGSSPDIKFTSSPRAIETTITHTVVFATAIAVHADGPIAVHADGHLKTPMHGPRI